MVPNLCFIGLCDRGTLRRVRLCLTTPLIVLHSKDADPLVLIAEAGAIVLLAGAAYVMSAKEKKV
ncbi:hypothetical protein N9Q61_02650 [Amylibacter sp.]|nr:hypothetical protein [Amylibacter sp.]